MKVRTRVSECNKSAEQEREFMAHVIIETVTQTVAPEVFCLLGVVNESYEKELFTICTLNGYS